MTAPVPDQRIQKELESLIAQHGDVYLRELTRTFQQFEERVRDLSAICGIVDALKHGPDVRRVFEGIVEVLIDETNAENCALMLFKRDTGELIVKAARGQTDPVGSYYHISNGSGRRFHAVENVAVWVAQHGEAVSISDISKDRRFFQGLGYHKLAGSLLCLPLAIDNEIVGVVSLNHPRANAFTAEDERLMTLIKDQVAIAFNTIQIFDDTQQLNGVLKKRIDVNVVALRKTNAELRDQIRERQRAEEALRESEARLEGLVAHLPDGVCLLDEGRRLVLVNPSAREYLRVLEGGAVGEVVRSIGGKPLEALLEPGADERPHEVVVGEVGRRAFEIVARPITQGRGEGGWALVIREVTLERELQDRVQQQERLAAVGQLAAGISHDFNNMLVSTIGYAEVLGLREDIPESAKADLERIVEGGERAAQLVRQILDFSRRTVAQREPVELVSFLKEVVKLLKRTLPENIHIVVEFDRGDFSVEFNLTQLQQVITNLAINARDAMPGGGELRLGLSHRQPGPGEARDTWVALTVSDTGAGIPPEVLDHLFEPFFTTKRPGEGTGLGLAQVYGIVKQHGGAIQVDSEVGRGTTFCITLPRVADEAAAEEETEGAIPRGRGETVLVVEDREDVRLATQSMLESLNYRVLTAADGQEAETVYELHRDEIALVLTDLVMPEIGGVELIEALKEKDPGVRMVVMTGYPLGRERKAPRDIAGWLEKPLRLDRLGQVVRKALEK